jgi:phosphatidylglycerophosphatase A
MMLQTERHAAHRAAWRRAPGSMALATWFGVGHIPGGPGTYAAILSLPWIWAMSHTPLPARLIACIALTLLSFVWCDRAEAALGEEDSRRIVLDEVVGVWIALVAFTDLSLAQLAVGCLAFRLFDIWKPWPIRPLTDRFEGGVAVVIDDVMAGLIAIPFVALLALG